MQDFTKGNITKSIVLFALPMLLGNIFQQVYSMVDSIIVGRFVSGIALAAVGAGSSILFLLLSLLIGLTTGASIVISQFYGARQEDKLMRAVSTSVVFLGLLAVVLTAIGYAGSSFFLRLLDVPADVFDDAAAYLRICMTGLIFQVYYNMYTAYLRALGDSRRPLYFLIISVILNAVLDYVFVALLHMGVAGAAWATVISQAVAAVACFLYAHLRVPLLHVAKLQLDRTLLRQILRYSIPSAIQMSMTSLVSLTITRLVNGFGAVSVAGYTAATKIDQFATMPLSNISMATSTFVAQNMGAGQEDRARKGLRSAMLFMVGLGLAVSVFAILFGKPLISLFIDAADVNAAQIIEVGASYLSIIALFYVLFAVFFAFNGFFRGVGDAVVVMGLTIVSLSLRSICAHILVHVFSMGPEAVAWSIPVGWSLCSIFAFFYYKRRKWAGKSVVKTKESPAQEA